MLPEILSIAEKHGLVIDERSLGKQEVRVKCPFCNEDSKPGKKRKFYLSLNTRDQVFKCWFCGEAGGVFRFISLLEGIPEPEVLERYKGKRRNLHPAEKLTSRQLKMIGFHGRVKWREMKKRDYGYYLRTCQYVWSEWMRFIQVENYFLFRILVSAIEQGNYQKALAIIKEKEKKIGFPLLETLLKIYSQGKWPEWAIETVKIGMSFKKQKEVVILKRKIQRLESQKWVDVEPEMVKEGDIIRFFEPNGCPVQLRYWPKEGQSKLKVTKVIPMHDGHYRFVGEPV